MTKSDLWRFQAARDAYRLIGIPGADEGRVAPRRTDGAAHRRSFLRFLAASPLLSSAPAALLIEALLGSGRPAAGTEGSRDGPGHKPGVITGPEHAINVFDLETAARDKLPAAHWGYLTTGVDDDATLRANRIGFSRLLIRPRRLVDVSTVNMSTELFGVTWKSPIALAPAGSQRTFHPDGEIATARAAASRGHLQILSTGTTASVEDVTAARRGPVWFQLYPTSSWSIAQALIRRAEAAGCPVVVITVDLPVGRNAETERRIRRSDPRTCTNCHEAGLAGYLRRKPMFAGLDLMGIDSILAPGLTWDSVRRLRDSTRMKVVLKGIVTGEDATLCVQHGVDGIIVSNHGGRSEESGRGTIECLPEVVAAVQGRIPVLIDGGFRRGTDVFKALALGARAICIGRPYLWGLASFGQAGVERVLDILRWELELIMKQAGVPALGMLNRSFLVER